MATLAKHDDPYLSANGAVFEARSLVEQKQIEVAWKRLATLGAKELALRDHTLHAADVRFLIGYCQLHTLHYDEAIKTLETFAKDYPNASERLQATAKQIVQELRRRKANGMSDVADLMAYAGRRLGHGTSNEPVTSKQAKAVALLDELIKTAEEKECKGGGCKKCGGKGKGCKACGGPPNGNQQPSSPANQSKLPGGGVKTVFSCRSNAPMSTIGGVPLPVFVLPASSTKRGLPSKSVMISTGTASLFPASVAGEQEPNRDAHQCKDPIAELPEMPQHPVLQLLMSPSVILLWSAAISTRR